MSEEISDRKAPGFWFYTADFERDMQILPLAAQGLWIRMMCWASDNEEHRGFIELPTGAPMTLLDIAHRVGKPIKEVRSCIEAMRRLGTFSEDSRGCIFSRRMARDTHISEVRRHAASRRASVIERAKDGTFAGTKQPTKVEQKPTVTASVSVSVPVNTNTCPTPGICAPDGAPEFVLSPAVQNGNGTGHSHQRKWFEDWWAVYWRKVSRKTAEKVFYSKVKTLNRFEQVMLATKAQLPTMLAREPDHRPHGATWLNAERWNDVASPRAIAPPTEQPEYYDMRKEREQEAERRRKIEEQGFIPIRPANRG